MQVKERHSWEILRDYLEQDDSQGLNDYLSALTGEQSLRAITRLEPEEQQSSRGLRDVSVSDWREPPPVAECR